MIAINVLAIVSVFVVCGATEMVCPGGQKCADWMTCCDRPDGGQGCCPYSGAECCADHVHCCPEGYKCAEYSCYNHTDGTTMAKMKFTFEIKESSNDIDGAMKTQVPVSAVNMVCPDRSSCLDTQTCCPISNTTFGCCPYENGTCCDDLQTCCPSDYNCVGAVCMRRGGKETISASPLNTICPGGSQSCPSGDTCCPTGGGQYGCCPLLSATCCNDMTHCCPHGYRCSSGGTCFRL